MLLPCVVGLWWAVSSIGLTSGLLPAEAQEAKPARVTEVVHSQGEGSSQVLVRVDGSVTHRTEQLSNPPRLALDILGAVPGTRVGTVAMKDPRIRQIRSSHYRAKDPSIVRLVFDLVAPMDFEARAVPEGVLVVFKGSGVAKGPVLPRAEGTGPASKPPSAVTVPLPPAPAARPPVAFVPGAQAPAPSARSRAHASQVPTVGPPAGAVAQASQAPATPPPSPPRRSQNKLISMDFKEAEIGNLLRILAEFSGVNIVAGEDVKGKVTVKLHNVPWDQALEAVVKGAKMAYVREGNIIRVDKLENLSKEAEAQIKLEQAEEEFKTRQEERRIQIEAQRQRAQFEIERLQKEWALKARQDEVKARAAEQEQAFKEAPLVEATIQLKYAHVGTRKVELLSFFRDSTREEDRKGIEDAVKPLLTTRGSHNIDERTNSITLRDVPDNVERIKKFIETVDQPVPTIQIDARIVEINRDDAVQLGVQWGGILTAESGRDRPVTTVRGNTGAGGTSVVDLLPVLPSGVGTGLAVGVIASNFALDAALKALETRGRANVVSRPSVVTQENQPATVASGEQLPIITTTSVQGAPQASVTFKDVTTRIQVIPRTTPEKRLVLTVAVKKEDLIEIIREPGIVAPRTSTRQGITTVILDNGQTAVIGGLQVENRTEREQGIPFLSRIPLLGWVFKNHTDDTSVREIMIFLTARIVEGVPKGAKEPASETPPRIGAAGPGGPSASLPPAGSVRVPPPTVALPGPTELARPQPDVRERSWR